MEMPSEVGSVPLKITVCSSHPSGDWTYPRSFSFSVKSGSVSYGAALPFACFAYQSWVRDATGAGQGNPPWAGMTILITN